LTPKGAHTFHRSFFASWTLVAAFALLACAPSAIAHPKITASGKAGFPKSQSCSKAFAGTAPTPQSRLAGIRYIPELAQHVLSGQFEISLVGPTIRGGLHVVSSMKRFLEERPDLGTPLYELDPSGSGVLRVILSEAAFAPDHYRKVVTAFRRSGEVNPVAGKTLFPPHWGSEQVFMALHSFLENQLKHFALRATIQALGADSVQDRSVRIKGDAHIVYNGRAEKVRLEVRGSVDPKTKLLSIRTAYPAWPQSSE
jgi:hypothetical protein